MRDLDLHRRTKRKHYLANKPDYAARVAARRKQRKIWYESLKTKTPCVICGENEPVCIDYHHIEANKDETVSKLINDLRSHSRVLNELQKCVPICSNCHRKVHKGIIEVVPTFDWTLVIEAVGVLPTKS